jgi:hypothetical protein
MRVPAREAPHILSRDQVAVFIAQKRFEQNLDRKGKPFKVGRNAGLGQPVQPVDVMVAKSGARAKGILLLWHYDILSLFLTNEL